MSFVKFVAMQEVSQISEFGKILVFLITGLVMTGALLFLNKLIAPDKPNPEKLSSYECGEEPTGSSWVQLNSRFYVIALIFLLFDVEMVFIFPWATVFGIPKLIAEDNRWGWLSLIEMFVFMGILILGLIYVWVKGDLQWIKNKIVQPRVAVNIPASVYDKINQMSYVVKPFSAEEKTENIPVKEASVTTEVRKPMFKPKLKI
ncbi:MAG: NADH-quinone oxidoreductase subunit A [Janthinobacterium lividum]